MEKFAVSERRACELNHVDRSSYCYEPRPDRNTALRDKLTELARQKPRFGYRRLGVLLEKNGMAVNHKRLFRVYQEAGLGVRRREKKRLERGRVGMALLIRPNQEWSLDFVSDALATGRAIRALTVLDDFTRESPAIEVDSSLSAPRVTRVLDGVIDATAGFGYSTRLHPRRPSGAVRKSRQVVRVLRGVKAWRDGI